MRGIVIFSSGIGAFGGADGEISLGPDAFFQGKTQNSLGSGEKCVGARLFSQEKKQIPQGKSSASHVPEPFHQVNFKISLFGATAPLVNFKNNLVKTRFTQGKMPGHRRSVAETAEGKSHGFNGLSRVEANKMRRNQSPVGGAIFIAFQAPLGAQSL